MDRFLHLNWSFSLCKTWRPLLALIWFLGLFFGAIAVSSADAIFSLTMHSALYGSLSIFGLLAALLLPLLLTAFAVYVSKPILILFFAFFKAFLFAFTAAGLSACFTTAAWLVRCLLMFSDILILPVLWLVWLRSFEYKPVASLRCSAIAAMMTCMIGCFDFAVVAPFLMRLI